MKGVISSRAVHPNVSKGLGLEYVEFLLRILAHLDRNFLLLSCSSYAYLQVEVRQRCKQRVSFRRKSIDALITFSAYELIRRHETSCST